MKRKMLMTVLLIAVLTLPIIINTQKSEQQISLIGELGTNSKISLYGKKSSAKRLRDYIKNADSLFSLTKQQSELSRLNNGETVTLSPDTAELLKFSQEFAEPESFNPFAGALFEVWNNAIKSEKLPSEAEIKEASSASFPISLKLEGNTAHLENPNQKVSFGAIGKGYITNKLTDILKEEKVESALIDLGGNIYAHGRKADGSPWKVAVQAPQKDGEYIGIISANDTAVVTSGNYERFFEADGKKYHHIINPKTGYPAENGLSSVSIITADALIADMLSTKCFIIGFEASKSLLTQYNADAIFVTDADEVYYSKDLEGIFNHDNNSYTYIPF